MAGIYIHFPFCVSKCTYCDFYSIASTDRTLHHHFLDALGMEIHGRAYELEGVKISTIYFGGGTPSLFTADEIGIVLQLLRQHHTILPDAEVTIECNPGDLSRIDIHRLLEVGINRFSIGAQSFHPELLRFLTRRHSADETDQLVHALQEAGVTNYSLDLIYGIPGETLPLLRADLEHLIALNPAHISAYHLMYEPGTFLTARLTRGEVKEVSEELSLQMFDMVNSVLKGSGYEHYEVSNYARPGFRSKHNSSYWQGVEYQGLGPSAHSFIQSWRSWNPPSVHSYIEQLSTAHFVARDFEFITPQMQYMEYILTRLRTAEGLSLTYIRDIFGTACYDELLQKSTPYLQSQHLIRRGDALSLSPSGLLISDAIIEELS